MKKLHIDGLLTLFDLESYEKCEACLLGKMTKMPFSGFLREPQTCWNTYIRMCTNQ
jgi:hypothetical protein